MEEQTTVHNGRPTRVLGIAALSSLSTPPDEMVRYAGEAGFDVVGVRVAKVTEAEPAYDLSAGSSLRRRVLTALDETGLRVHDAEFLLLDGSGQRDTWRQALDDAAGLGAATFTVAASDFERARLVENLGLMSQDAKDRGIVVTLEPISYQAVRSVTDAAALARETECAVLADTLHLTRFGATDEELDAAADVIGGIQLVDGPLAPPPDQEGLVRESRTDRRAPGEGEFPLGRYLRHLPEALPVSVECCSEEYVAHHGARAWVRHLAERARTVLGA